MKNPNHPEKPPTRPGDSVDDAARGLPPACPAPDPPPEPFQPWECPCCHEPNDGTFDICWNCQTTKSEE